MNWIAYAKAPGIMPQLATSFFRQQLQQSHRSLGFKSGQLGKKFVRLISQRKFISPVKEFPAKESEAGTKENKKSCIKLFQT